MAITQISKITHRKGLNENLPQLAGAELGWALDARRLYIGNGKIVDGAPTIGNTEVLTQYSNILEITNTYTYKGTATGYQVVTGADVSNPITRTLQQKFDDIVSVRDFGAKGDGETDDTVAINNALRELYTREVSPLIRRSLFFPAGTYKVTDTINVPSYAKLYGEGAKSTTIKYYQLGGSPVADAVIMTADSKNQTGANIGNFSATTPTDIEISSMGFESTVDTNSVFILENITNSSFSNISLVGPETISTIGTSVSPHACIRVKGNALLPSKNIVFDNCNTSGTRYGMYIDDVCNGLTLSNSKLHIHYKGVRLVNGNVSGVRIVQNVFDDIYDQGISFGGTVRMNVSAFNMFYDVGNYLNGVVNPETVIIDIDNADNVSMGDMFERNDASNAIHQRISLNETASIAFDLGNKIVLGTYAREVGKTTTLMDGTLTSASMFVVDLTNTHTNSNTGTFKMDYAIERNGTVRTGSIDIACDGGTPGSLTYNEAYTENAISGIAFSVTQSTNDVSVKYTSTTNGHNAKLSYSIVRLY